MYIFLVVCVYILVVYILVVYILVVYIYIIIIIIIIIIYFFNNFFICSLDNSWSKLFSLDCDEDEISMRVTWN